VFVRKDDDVVFEDDEEVSELFAISLARRLSLVSVQAGIAPQGEESPVAEVLQVPFARRDPFLTIDAIPVERRSGHFRILVAKNRKDDSEMVESSGGAI
jgi:hypothetical protein